MNPINSKSPVRTLATAWLMAGTLDILSAIFFLAGGNASGVFRYIARGAFGDSAMQGGIGMILAGAVFHYFIAFCFTTGYFFISPFFKVLHRYKILAGLCYGIFVWSFMHFLVLPLTHNVPAPFSLAGDWKNIVILMFAVGLPVSLFSASYNRNK
jgi:hypothetical protein